LLASDLDFAHFRLENGYLNSYFVEGVNCAISTEWGRIQMETRIAISEAKNKLTSIIHSVEKGPSVKLTRRGRPVAVLLSISEYEALKKVRLGFWDALQTFQKQDSDIDISDQDFEDVRDASPGRLVDL
jgi:prevent-host-death family protein